MNLANWKKNIWKIALYGVSVLLVIKFIILPLLAWTRGAVGSARTGAASWWNYVEQIPFWVWPVVLLVGAIVFMAVKDGKTASERTEKATKLFWAFLKLALGIAVLLFLCVFIVGPRAFWGDYTPPEEYARRRAEWERTNAVATPLIPSLGGGTTGGVAPVVATPPEFPKNFRITALPGNPNDPRAPWSAPIQVAGHKWRCSVANNSSAPFAVRVDSGQIFIIYPGSSPHLGKPNAIQFLSPQNFPIEIEGRVE
jgi:hypothetical protein